MVEFSCKLTSKSSGRGVVRVQTTGFPHANGTDGIDLQSQFGIPSLDSNGMCIFVVASSILCHEYDRVWQGAGYITTGVLYRVQCLIYQADLKQIFCLH